jgi:hypothetical protein
MDRITVHCEENILDDEYECGLRGKGCSFDLKILESSLSWAWSRMSNRMHLGGIG